MFAMVKRQTRPVSENSRLAAPKSHTYIPKQLKINYSERESRALCAMCSALLLQS
jgi:hypothetical protein